MKTAPISAALLLSVVVITSASAQTPSAGSAQAYPNRPVRIVLPYTPGGPADIVLRIVGQKLSEGLAQPIVIDNRGGASGMIGSELVAKALPDGYTLLFGTIQTHGVNASLFNKMPYHPINDFTPVAAVTTFPFLLTVHPSLPATSVKELIALAKSQPGRLNYSSAGSGTGTHLAGELLKSMAQIDLVHIPYKGGGDALTDVVAGRVQLTFTGVPPGLPFVKAGKLKALAVTGAKRLRDLPDVPTVAETLPGFEVSSWNGLFAPKGTPEAVVARLNAEVGRILRLEDVKERLAGLGADPFIESPAAFARYVRDENVKWAKVVKAAGIKAE
jgi:tripartite-type tricarboxylate transporter receptor subunit TctC